MFNLKNLIFIDLHLFEEIINRTDSPGMPDEMPLKFYDKRLIDLAGPKLVHDQFAQKRNIPKHSGKTINFRRFNPLPKATTPLTEGVTPPGQTLSESKVEATVDQFGDYVKLTDRSHDETIDELLSVATKLVSSQAGRTLDTITRDIITAGTYKRFAPQIIDGEKTDIAFRKDVNANCKLTCDVINLATTDLEAHDTPTIDGSYMGIIHPYAKYDLINDPRWIDVVKYRDAERIYNKEIGKIGNVRFVESTEAKIIGPANIINGKYPRIYVRDAVEAKNAVKISEVMCETQLTGLNIPVYVNGVENTITELRPGTGDTTITLANAVTCSAGDLICGTGAGSDGSAIYVTQIVGEDAYGTTEIEGGGLELIVKDLGSAGAADPLNQRSTVGWKARKTAVRLVEPYMMRIESAGDYSAIAVSN